MPKDTKEIVLVEKYRPKCVNDVICNNKESIVNSLKNPSSIPHFLFTSVTPGTGKTSMAKAIINELKCDKLILNSSNERKIDVIRNKVKIFACSSSWKKGLKRCIFLDEFDGMTKAAQDALRNMMESYSSSCFFILTCNHVEKVIDPIRSRCMEIEFKKPDRLQIGKLLGLICSKESIPFDAAGLKQLITTYYPSIRNMVMKIQEMQLTGKTLTKDVVLQRDKEYEDAWKLIVNGQFNKIQHQIMVNGLNAVEFSRWLFSFVVLNRQSIGIAKMKQIIYLLAQNERDFALSVDMNIIFLSSVLRIMEILSK